MLEEIDPTLEPVLAKSFIKRGNATLIKLGDKEVDYNPDFRLYVTTKMGALPPCQALCCALQPLQKSALTEAVVPMLCLMLQAPLQQPGLDVQYALWPRQQSLVSLLSQRLRPHRATCPAVLQHQPGQGPAATPLPRLAPDCWTGTWAGRAAH